MANAVKLASVMTKKAVWTVTASSHSVERMESRERGASLVAQAIRAIGDELNTFAKTDEVLIRFPSLNMSVIIGFRGIGNFCQVITVLDNGNAWARQGTLVRVA